MKKIVLIATLFLSTNAFCQKQKYFSLEANAGLVFYQQNIVSSQLAKLPIKPGEQGKINPQHSSVNLSLLLAYQLNQKFAVKAGIGYQARHFNLTELTPLVAGIGGSDVKSVEFFNIPLRVEYKLKHNERFDFFVNAGFSIRFSSRPDNQLWGNLDKKTDGLNNVLNERNLLLTSRSEKGSFNGDSSLLILTTYYQFNKVDVFANAGAGMRYKLGKKLSAQFLVDFNFQLNKGNFFGKYSYEELYNNGTFVGQFEDHLKGSTFRDNFYTASLGLVYKLK